MTSYDTRDHNSAPTPPGPVQRVTRTVLQVVIAVCAAVPAAVALLPLDPDQVAWPIGLAGAGVILVSALQNGLEDMRGKG